MQFQPGFATLAVGPSIEVGGLRASGHADDPRTRESSGGALIITSALSAEIRGRLAERISLDAAVTAGGVLRGVTILADTRESIGFAGFLLGLRVGAGFDL